MKRLILAIALAGLLASTVFLTGCTGNDNSQHNAQCQSTYNSCTQSCDNYWLGSDKESCKSNCLSAYNSCKL